jgi:hypothetical protein
LKDLSQALMALHYLLPLHTFESSSLSAAWKGLVRNGHLLLLLEHSNTHRVLVLLSAHPSPWKKTPVFGALASQNSLRRTTCGIARGKHKETKCKGNEKKTRGATQEEEQRSLRGLQRTLVVGHCHPYGPWNPIYDPRKASV